MELITMHKPSGKEVKVNSNSLKYALSIGWKSTEPEEPKQKKNNKGR